MKIRLIWWYSIGTGAESSLINNVNGFREAGDDVEVVLIHDLKKEHLEKGADLIITPCLELAKYNIEIPVIFQLGGFAPGYLHPSGLVWFNLNKITEKGPLVILDTSLYYILYAFDPTWDFSNVYLLPNGVDLDFYKEPRNKDDKFRVFGPSGTITWKDPETFLHGLTRFLDRFPDTEAVVVVNDLKTVWKFVGHKQIRFVTPRFYKDIRDFYAESSVVTPFSAAEIFPNTVMEAMIFGRPVIVRRIGNLQTVHHRDIGRLRKYIERIEPIEEIYEELEPLYFKGFHYMRTDMEAVFVELLTFLYENPEEIKFMSREARKFAEKWFTWKDRARLFKRIYSEVW